MLNTVRASRGMVTSPHHLASQAGANVLRDGGSAIEAGVAMAACLAVTYPHMTGIGGDGFWLISHPGEAPISIDASGTSGRAITPELFQSAGYSQIPWRGPLAAITSAGTIGGWQAALSLDKTASLPLDRLFEDAIYYAEKGIAATASQAETTAEKLSELLPVSGFGPVFAPGNQAPLEGAIMKNPALAETFKKLAKDGLRSFYEGALAQSIAADLARAGSPLTAEDFADQSALIGTPLSLQSKHGEIYNLAPPTQGAASLMILGIFERLGIKDANGFDHLHGLIEATKCAFAIRDREIGDPGRSNPDLATHLSAEALDRMAASIDPKIAAPWPAPVSDGDTVWFGAIDQNGTAVSLIQSVFFEFGSGIVLPDTGITWQNRGCSLSLSDLEGPRACGPGRKPFHTLNPALARFKDGRTMVYGTMGGEGQPQTQAALFTRYAEFGMGLQDAITAPRWLLGKTWGESESKLRLEDRTDPAVIKALEEAGHPVDMVGPFSSVMGHAGAIVLRPDGIFEGASDPRSDGAAVGY